MTRTASAPLGSAHMPMHYSASRFTTQVTVHLPAQRGFHSLLLFEKQYVQKYRTELYKHKLYAQYM